MNKDITKAIRNDIRTFNNGMVTKTIEENKSMEVLRQRISKGKKEICILRNKEDRITTDKKEILKVVEEFYKELYATKEREIIRDPIPKILNQGSEEILEITIHEMQKSICEMKNNKSPGEVEMAIEALKLGG